MELKPLLVLAFVALSGSTAFGKPKPQDEKAKQLYFEAERVYAVGEYLRAAELFEEAYRLSSRPELLFNMANAYERALELEKAIGALEQYLDQGSLKTATRTSIRQRIAHLRARAEETKKREQELTDLRARAEETKKREQELTDLRKKQEEEAAAAAASQKIVAEPPPPAEAPYPPMMLAGWILVGTGAAGIALGGVLGALSLSAGSEARALCSEGGMRLCQQSATGSLDREEGLALGTDIALGVGLAAAITGTVLLLVGRSEVGS